MAVDLSCKPWMLRRWISHPSSVQQNLLCLCLLSAMTVNLASLFRFSVAVPKQGGEDSALLRSEEIKGCVFFLCSMQVMQGDLFS